MPSHGGEEGNEADDGNRGGGDASSATVGVVSAEGLSLVKETQVAVVAKVTEVLEVETLRLPPCRCRLCRLMSSHGGEEGSRC